MDDTPGAATFNTPAEAYDRHVGRYGRELALQSRIDAVDMSLINIFAPGLGVGGRATGSIDFVQAGSAAGALISKATAQQGITLPWHPAAERYLLRPTATQ